MASPSGGSGVWVYSWEYKEGAGPWIVIPGEIGLTYDIPAGQTATRTYRRVATNDCGTGYSNEVTVTVYPNTVVGSITGNQTLCYNSDPLAITSVTLPTGGDGVWTYSWEYQSNCSGAWQVISGHFINLRSSCQPNRNPLLPESGNQHLRSAVLQYGYNYHFTRYCQQHNCC